MDEVLLSKRVIVLKDGNIVMECEPIELFSMNMKDLTKLNLYPPEIVQIINSLRENGISVPKEIISSKDLVDYLCQL
jgi:energy-coupling factor transporter ATP-binding protein EcfA2